MNTTWTTIINNIKASKTDKARCARECSAITTGDYKPNGKYGTVSADYSMDAKIIAKLVESHSNHFSNTFFAKMKEGVELSSKQTYAMSCAFNESEITFGDVKKAISDCGYDIERDYFSEDVDMGEYGFDMD